MVKGFAQKKGIYFDEIFSPIVKMDSIRTILSLVVVQYFNIEQLDVKNPFSMWIWGKIFICNNHIGIRLKGRRIWYAG